MNVDSFGPLSFWQPSHSKCSCCEQFAFSSAPLDKRSKQHLMSWNSRFDLHSPKRFAVVSKTTRPRALFTITLGQPAGLSKEACLYAGADWYCSSVREWRRKNDFRGLTDEEDRRDKEFSHQCRGPLSRLRTWAFGRYQILSCSSRWLCFHFQPRNSRNR